MLNLLHSVVVLDDAEMPDTRLHKIAKESPLVQRLLCTYALSLFKLGDGKPIRTNVTLVAFVSERRFFLSLFLFFARDVELRRILCPFDRLLQ